MRDVTFRQLLNEQNALRVRFSLDHGEVVKFVVQLECCFESKWTAVIRYDTAHGFAHCDKIHPYQTTEKTTLETKDYNEALTFALNDLQANWRHYRQRYEKWLEKK